MAYNFPKRLSLITSQTASAVSSIAFTTGISSNFTTYYVKIRGVTISNNSTGPNVTFSTNGGSSYLSTNYQYAGIDVGGVFGSASAANGAINSTLSNSSANVWNADLIFFNLNSNTTSPTYICHNTAQAATGINSSYVGGMNTTTTAVNAIKFNMSAGTFSTGTFTLYGDIEGGFLY